MSILVLADLHEGQLAGATAQAIGGDIDVLVACEGVQAASKLDGVSKVRVADNAVYAHQLAEPMGALLVELADGYTLRLHHRQKRTAAFSGAKRRQPAVGRYRRG